MLDCYNLNFMNLPATNTFNIAMLYLIFKNLLVKNVHSTLDFQFYEVTR